jgi:hypothetical protein
MGTKGELRAQMSSDTFTIYNFETRETEELKISDTVLGDSIVGGHGGGDAGIMRSLYDLLCGIEHPGLSTIDISVETHKIAFAAEISRLEGRAVKMSELE